MRPARWTLALAACSSDPVDPGRPTEFDPAGLGSLEIMTTHTGPTRDPDGYSLVLNGVSIGRMAVEDTVLLRNLPPAEYAVGIAGIAPGCDNGGGNPRGIRVETGRTTRVIFQVKCQPGSGPPPTS